MWKIFRTTVRLFPPTLIRPLPAVDKITLRVIELFADMNAGYADRSRQ